MNIRGCDKTTGVAYEYREKTGTICHAGFSMDVYSPLTPEKAAALGAVFTCNINTNNGLMVYHDGKMYLFYHRNDEVIFCDVEYHTKIKAFPTLVCTSKPPLELIENNPTLFIHVARLPLEHLIALGQTIIQISPVQLKKAYIELYKPNENKPKEACQEREEVETYLDGYWGGRMASDVSKMRLVVNQRFNTYENDSFLGRILSKDPLDDNPIWLLSTDNLHKVFPELTLAWRSLGSSIPIEISNNERFHKKTNWGKDRITIHIIGPKESEDKQSFLRFNSVFSKSDFAVSNDIQSADGKDVIMYRYSSSYIVREFHA